MLNEDDWAELQDEFDQQWEDDYDYIFPEDDDVVSRMVEWL